MSNLDLEIEGTLVKRGDEDYESKRRINFAANSHTRENSFPALIAVVGSIGDVQKCIKYANDRHLTVTVRSGGHNWYGSFLHQDVLLIDMTNFDSMEIDDVTKTAVVGPNCSGQSLNEAAAPKGLIFSSGHCSDVPLGGYLLGGGFGWFHEYYGMAAESVSSVKIVTPDGELIEASDEQNKEWMWLFRGAASAFPGVVVSIKVKLHPLPPILRSKMIFYPIAEFEKIVSFCLKHRRDGSLSKNIEIIAILGQPPPPLMEVISDSKICIMLWNCLANSEDEFSSITALVDDKLDATPYFPAEDFKDTSLHALSAMLGSGYQRDWQWIVRHYQMGLDADVNYTKLRDIFEKDSPACSDTRLSLLVAISPQRQMERPGVYSYPGVLIGTECGYPSIDDKNVPAFLKFTRASEELLKPVATKFSPLEYPVNRETFHNCFDDAEKLLAVRNKMDPSGRFFDPSNAKPWHLR